jgi:hypothetical protein
MHASSANVRNSRWLSAHDGGGAVFTPARATGFSYSQTEAFAAFVFLRLMLLLS